MRIGSDVFGLRRKKMKKVQLSYDKVCDVIYDILVSHLTHEEASIKHKISRFLVSSLVRGYKKDSDYISKFK